MIPYPEADAVPSLMSAYPELLMQLGGLDLRSRRAAPEHEGDRVLYHGPLLARMAGGPRYAHGGELSQPIGHGQPPPRRAC